MCRSDIEQAEDQDSSRMQARLKYIPIEQLVHYAGKKVSSSHDIAQCAPHHICTRDRYLPLLRVTFQAGCMTPGHVCHFR